MARKSRKDSRRSGYIQTADTAYRAALYVRISADEHNRGKGYTIENQLEVLYCWLKKNPDIAFYREYSDNGVSGVGFDRPGYNSMIADMRAGLFNCIIVKDFSRLGRNYLEAGEYLEKIFPFFGIRFISVTDNYDSLHPSVTEDGLVVPLKNMINEMYAKDLSQKVSSAFQAKQRQGKFVGAFAPYGYKKSGEDKGRLIVDEEVREVIALIYDRRAENQSYSRIARTLNARNIPCPSRYKFLNGTVKKDRSPDGKWTISSVRSILENPVYIGDMEQGINHAALYKGQKNHIVPKDERIYVSDTHEGIVSREVFSRVREIEKANKEKFHKESGKYDHIGKEENLFRGILYCSDCDRVMTMWRDRSGASLRNPKVYYRYICQRRQGIMEPNCPKKNFPKEKLEKAVEESLRWHIRQLLNVDEAITKLNRTPHAAGQRDMIQRSIRQTEREMDRLQEKMSELYDDFKDGLLDEKEYLFAKEKRCRQSAELERQKKEQCEMLAACDEKDRERGEMAETAMKYADFKKLNRELISAFISRIDVYAGQRIEIHYRFRDEYEESLKILAERAGTYETECNRLLYEAVE